jgi:putative NADH-flavin reductase
MKFVLFGATGGVGKALLEQALEHGDTVTVLVRDPAKLGLSHPNLIVEQGDAFSAEDVANVVAGQDAVVSCLNTSKGILESDELERMGANISQAMQKHGVKRIVYCASAGVDNEMPGEYGKRAMEMLRNPLTDHRNAINQLKEAKLDITVARPLGLIDGALTGKYEEAREGIPSSGYTINRADVAHFMHKALHDDSYIGASVAVAN